MRFVYLSVAVLLFVACDSAVPKNENPTFATTVFIDYGEIKNSKKLTIETTNALTALEALQYASVVQTHPVGHYVFVSAIDSVYNIKGVNAWYYKVNGEPAKVLAINNKLNNGDTLQWIYKQDVCSKCVK